MTILNGYATLSDFQGLKVIETQDEADDYLVEKLIESASDFINSNTGRKFYPWVQTRYFNIPKTRELWLDEDLLEIITLTNGEGTVISANSYYFKPQNETPRYSIILKQGSNLSWLPDTSGNTEYILPVNGIWGFHDQYNVRSWSVATQVNKIGGLTATDNPIPVDVGTAVVPGKIIKIDNEIMICDANDQTNITVINRGDNGSTAVTHADDAKVYIYNPMPVIHLACLEIVKATYQRRFGTNTTGVARVTAMGVVITPEDVPTIAWNIITRYKRTV